MSAPRTVLVARSDNLGDVLLTGPAVRAIAAQARVVMLCSPQGRPAAELLPGVAEVVEAHLSWIDAQPRPFDHTSADDLLAQLRGAAADTLVVLASSHQSPLPLAAFARMAGIGEVAAVSHDYAGALLDVRLRGIRGEHEVERNLRVAAALGFSLPAGDDGRLAIAAPRADGRSDRSLGPGRGARKWIVHPGASVPARTLSPDAWRAAVTAICAEGIEVLVTGARREWDLCEHVTAQHPCATNAAGSFTFAELAGAMRRCDVVITGNTGPMHLAAAAGTPVVAAFPPTVDVDAWRPWMVPHELLGRLDIGCAGCRSRLCPIPRQPCLATLTPAAVLAAARRVIERASPPRVTAIRAEPAPAVAAPTTVTKELAKPTPCRS